MLFAICYSLLLFQANRCCSMLGISASFVRNPEAGWTWPDTLHLTLDNRTICGCCLECLIGNEHQMTIREARRKAEFGFGGRERNEMTSWQVTTKRLATTAIALWELELDRIVVQMKLGRSWLKKHLAKNIFNNDGVHYYDNYDYCRKYGQDTE